MPRNGSGSYSLPQAQFVSGTTISSAAMNSDLNDIAAALTGSVSADGQTTMSGPIKGAAGSVGAPTYSTASDPHTGFYSVSPGVVGFSSNGTQTVQFGPSGVQTPAGAVQTIPIGTVIDFAGTTPPAGWYLCFGQLFLRSSFPALFNVIGDTYKTSGDGVTNFNLPDCRGRSVSGKDDMGGSAANRLTNAGSFIVGTTLGATGGAQNETLGNTNVPLYTPTGTTAGSVSVSDTRVWSGLVTSATGSGGIAAASTNQNSGTATQNIQVTSGTITASFSGGTFTATNSYGTGSPTPVVTMQPTIVFNKIIFAGA